MPVTLFTHDFFYLSVGMVFKILISTHAINLEKPTLKGLLRCALLTLYKRCHTKAARTSMFLTLYFLSGQCQLSTKSRYNVDNIPFRALFVTYTQNLIINILHLVERDQIYHFKWSKQIGTY